MQSLSASPVLLSPSASSSCWDLRLGLRLCVFCLDDQVFLYSGPVLLQTGCPPPKKELDVGAP